MITSVSLSNPFSNSYSSVLVRNPRNIQETWENEIKYKKEAPQVLSDKRLNNSDEYNEFEKKIKNIRDKVLTVCRELIVEERRIRTNQSWFCCSRISPLEIERERKQFCERNEIFVSKFHKSYTEYQIAFSQLKNQTLLNATIKFVYSNTESSRRLISLKHMTDPVKTPLFESNFYISRLYTFLGKYSIKLAYQDCLVLKTHLKLYQFESKIVHFDQLPETLIDIIMDYVFEFKFKEDELSKLLDF